MNVDTMRRIDGLAGTPLCAVATLLLRLRGLFRFRSLAAAGATHSVCRIVGDGDHDSCRAGDAQGARAFSRHTLLRDIRP
jgi:hypothetical protein